MSTLAQSAIRKIGKKGAILFALGVVPFAFSAWAADPYDGAYGARTTYLHQVLVLNDAATGQCVARCNEVYNQCAQALPDQRNGRCLGQHQVCVTACSAPPPR